MTYLVRKAAGELAIHHLENDNPHCHFLMSTRQIEYGIFTTKTRILDDKKTGAIEVEAIRAAWANAVNVYLEMEGINETVTHKSFAKQGVNLISTKHEGPKKKGSMRAQLKRKTSLSNYLIN